MIPQLLGTFRTIFDSEERGKVFGAYGATLGFASAIGLVLGGVLTQADLFGWGWRTVFFVNIPVAIVSLIATIRVVPESSDPEAGRPDLLGAGVLAASIVAIAYPLLEGRSLGWPAWISAMLAGRGRGAGRAWRTVIERLPRVGVAPLLRTRLLRIPAFSAGLLVRRRSPGAAGLLGDVRGLAPGRQGFSPLGAGLTLLAFSIGSFVLAPFAVPLAQRHGRGILSLGGFLMAVGVLAVLLGSSQVGSGSDPWPVVPGLVVAGAGLSLMIIPLVNVVLAAVPHEVTGGAGGMFSTAQQLGGALGVAVAGTVFFTQVESHPFTEAFKHSEFVVIGLFAGSRLLALTLPRTAVSEEDVAGL